VATAIDEAKAEGLRVAQEITPNTTNGAPYATGKAASSWEWKGNRLVNTADHWKHTDQGDTRYGGKGSAKFYRASGVGKYSDRIAQAVALKLREVLRNG
jgi:hypothetical protein